MKILRHLDRQQLHRAGAENEGRVGEASVETGHTVEVVEIGGIHLGRLDHRVGDRAADPTDPESRRDGGVAEDRVAFETALAVEAVDAQQRPVAPQRRTPTGAHGIGHVHRAVAVTVELVERCREDPKTGIAEFVDTQFTTGDRLLIGSGRPEVGLLARGWIGQRHPARSGQHQGKGYSTQSSVHRVPLPVDPRASPLGPAPGIPNIPRNR